MCGFFCGLRRGLVEMGGLDKVFPCSILGATLFRGHDGEYRSLGLKEFGGKGVSKKRVYRTKKQPMHGMEHSIDMTLPPLSTIYLKYRDV